MSILETLACWGRDVRVPLSITHFYNGYCLEQPIEASRCRHFSIFPLGVCRTWGIEREQAAERGQIVTISLVHSGTMGQERGEILTAETRLQPIPPQSDRFLGVPAGQNKLSNHVP